MNADWSPELIESEKRFRAAIERAQLKLDSVPPELRERFQVEFEKFKRQLNGSDIQKMLLKIEAITPRTKR